MVIRQMPLPADDPAILTHTDIQIFSIIIRQALGFMVGLIDQIDLTVAIRTASDGLNYPLFIGHKHGILAKSDEWLTICTRAALA